MVGVKARGEPGMNGRDGLSAFLVIVIWGFNFIAIKLGTQTVPPLLLTGLRFVLVALLVLPFCPVPRRQLPLLLLLSSLMGCLHFGLLFVSQAGLDVPTSAIISQLAVPFSAIVAKVIYGERLGGRGLLGMGLSFAGVVLVVGNPHLGNWASLVFGVISAAAWALSMAVIKKIGAIHPLVLSGWMAVLAAPQLVILSALFEANQLSALANAGWKGWGAVLYTGLLATMVAYSLWYRLLARYPINRVVPWNMLSPIIAVLAGVMVLGGSLGWSKVLGGAVTMIGVAALQLRKYPERPSSGPAVANLPAPSSVKVQATKGS